MRRVEVSFTLDVAEDGYDYAADADGRLEDYAGAALMGETSHPWLDGFTAGGPTGSGYVREEHGCGGAA